MTIAEAVSVLPPSSLPPDREAGVISERFLLGVTPGRGRCVIVAAEQTRVAIERWQTDCSPDQLIKREYQRRYVVRHVEDYPTFEGFFVAVRRIDEIAETLSAGTKAAVKLLVDSTTLGAPAVEQLWKHHTPRPITVDLIDGRRVEQHGSQREWEIAEQRLSGALNAVAETGRLQISEKLSGRLHPEAVRTLSLILWFGERREGRTMILPHGGGLLRR